MKTRLRFLFAVLLIGSFAGCASQKKAPKPSHSAESEVLHQQALKALEEGRFVIQAEEFYFTGGQPVKSSPDSYISMKNNRAIIHYSPNLFPFVKYLHYMNIEDEAMLLFHKKKKNGEILYYLQVANSNPSYLNQKILITLFDNTNKCFINVGNTSSGFAFSGRIYLK